MSTPPRLPPGPPPAMQPPPKNKRAGCAIAAIVGVVVGVLGIAALGILAAIALPAYNQYLVRSQLATLPPKLEPLRQAIDAYRARHGTCPIDNAEVGVSPSLTYDLDRNGTRSVAVRVSAAQEGRCLVYVTFRNVAAMPQGAVLTLESDGDRWRCGGTVPAPLLPPQCKGGTTPTP